MRFWDASAIIPLLTNETSHSRAMALLEKDSDIIAWWGTPVEIASALARREREQHLSAEEAAATNATAMALAERWNEVLPSPSLRRVAQRLLSTHPLRAADSLQLAAALIAADHDPSTLEFVCFDARLGQAVTREGFKVIDR